MLRLSTFLSLFLICAQSFAQLAIEGNQWLLTYTYSASSVEDPNGVGYSTAIYSIAGDSVLNATTYKKLWIQDAPEADPIYAGLLRDTESNTFYIAPSTFAEILLYAFNQNQGDQPYFIETDANETFPMTIAETTMTTIGQEEIATYNFESYNGFATCLADTWYANIGSINGPLFPIDPSAHSCISGPPDIYRLSCFYSGSAEAIVWTDPNFSECYNATSIEEQLNKFNLEIFPNPVAEYLSVKFTSKQTIKSISFYDSMGRKTDTEFHSKNNNQLEIDISQLEQGIYTLTLINDKGVLYSDKIIISQ